MNAQLERRLLQLQAEYEAGQKALADLQAKEQNLEQTLQRIAGAIQIIKEDLAESN